MLVFNTVFMNRGLIAESNKYSYAGLTYLVYPGAVHSRFEHSLGVYWLAGEAIHRIKAHQVGYPRSGDTNLVHVNGNIFLIRMRYL